jgi:hypothetical protein
MILGRNAGLWLALVAGALNIAVVVFGLPLAVDQVVALNGFALVLVGVVANESDPSTVGTLAKSIDPLTVK